MASTPFASSTSTSFSSRPGSSAVTFTSLSVSPISMFGQPIPPSTPRAVPNGARSNPRKTSSNRRFISRCSVRKGLTSSPRRTVTSRPRFHGIKSRMLMSYLLSGKPLRRAGARGAVGPAIVRNRSGCLLLLDLLVVVAGVDLDPARLHGFRHLAHEVDLQQSAVERGALHLDVVGQVELAPERTRRDALVEVLVIALLGLAPLDGEHVLLRRDGDVLG